MIRNTAEKITIEAIVTAIYRLENRNFGISFLVILTTFGYKSIKKTCFCKIFATHIANLPQNNIFYHNSRAHMNAPSIFAASFCST